MEQFLESPKALGIFGIEQLPDTPFGYDSRTRHSAALETYSQIIHSMLDQVYHSPVALERGFSSSDILAKLEREQDIFPHVPGDSLASSIWTFILLRCDILLLLV